MESWISNKLMKVVSVIAFIFMIAVNLMAGRSTINGLNTAEVSARYGSLFTPAGITFSIWGVIYILLLMYTVYQTGLIIKHTALQAKVVNRINGPFILSCLLNALWIFCWHYERLLLSLIIMFALLATLIVIYLRIRNILKAGVPKNQMLYVAAPFSVYLGWITVAVLANFAVYLIGIDWSGWGISYASWTVVLILLTVFITLMVQRNYKDLLFTAVIVWALLGILIQHIVTFKMAYTLIIVTVVMSIAAVLVGVALLFSRRGRVRRKTNNLKHGRRKNK